MAGVKVTDLAPLGAAAADDILYIVDTSSNQSRKIEVQNLVGGIPDIESGDWSPTPTNTGGTNAVVTILKGNYSRVGSVVTCSLFYQIDMDAAESISDFTLNLPIASNFAFAKDAFGVVNYDQIGDGELQKWGIAANVASNVISMSAESTSLGHSFQYLYAVLQYVIIP